MLTGSGKEVCVMKKQILSYQKRIRRILDEADTGTDWKNILEIHLQQIAFYQHERLVHLLVLLAFACMEFISIGLSLLVVNHMLPILCVALLVLLIPYVMHYYFLENEVQKMYLVTDEIRKKMEDCQK